MKIKCSNCCFDDLCGCDNVCSNFAPLNEIDDDDIERLTEIRRRDFEVEYMSYINCFYGEKIF